MKKNYKWRGLKACGICHMVTSSIERLGAWEPHVPRGKLREPHVEGSRSRISLPWISSQLPYCSMALAIYF